MAIVKPTVRHRAFENNRGTTASGTALHARGKYGPRSPRHTSSDLKARGFTPISVGEVTKKVLEQDKDGA
jgi:hypothetical protein